MNSVNLSRFIAELNAHQVALNIYRVTGRRVRVVEVEHRYITSPFWHRLYTDRHLTAVVGETARFWKRRMDACVGTKWSYRFEDEA